MGPERTSHDPAMLEAQRNALNTTLEQNRIDYMNAKQRSGSWLRRLFRRGAADQAALANTRNTYEENRVRMIQLEARRATDAVATAGTADDLYRAELAAQVAERTIAEERMLTQMEMERNRNTTMARLRRTINPGNPMLRAAIGWGLNAGIGVSAATGALPLTWALVGARVATGTIGAEGTLAAIGNMRANRGERANLNQATIDALTVPDLNQRIASFSEYRINNGIQVESETERLLRARRQAMLQDAARTLFEADGLENWKRRQAIDSTREADRLAAETARDEREAERQAAETARAAREAERQAAETARDARAAEVAAREAERADAETRRGLAQNAITFNDGLLSDDRARGGLIDNAANLPTIEAACQRIANAKAQIDNLNALTPPPPNKNTLIRQQETIIAAEKRTIFPHAFGATPRERGRNTKQIIDSYQDRLVARNEETTQDGLFTAALTARNTAQAERDAREAEMAAAILARDARAAELATAEAARDARIAEMEAALAERDEARQLTTDQATRIHNILIGGAAAGAVAARPGWLRPRTEGLTTLNEQRLASERGSNRNRWLAALAIGGLATWLTTPEVNSYDWTHNGSGPNPDLRMPDQNTSNLVGRGEGLYWDYLNRHGANLVSEADFRNLIATDRPTHMTAINDYVNWVRINSPEALVPGQPELVYHNVNGHPSFIREPGNLDNFFGRWAGPHQWDPARSVMDAVRNVQVNLPNIPNPFPRLNNLRII